MQAIFVVISAEKTGERIQELMDVNGYVVRDVQEAMGLEYPQAVYKWLKGLSLPKIDHLVSLSKLFQTSIEDILVYDEGAVA